MTTDSFYRRFQRGVLHASSVRLEAARFNSYAWLLDRLVGFKNPMYRFAARRERAAMGGESAAAGSSASTSASVGFSAAKSTDGTIAGPLSPNPEDHKSESVMNDMTGLPIIFIHYSDSEYLKYILAQARLFNPTSPIYLIGDESNAGYATVEHRLMSDYFNSAAMFADIYRHFNTSGYHFECFNFQRWFILDEFLKETGISECVYLDTDTLLYTDVSKSRAKFADYDFTMSFMTSGSTFFLNRVAALSELCRFMMDIYAEKKAPYYDRLLSHYASFRKNGMAGGACDNTAFDYYRYEKFGSIGETAIILEGSFFDPSIDLPHPGLVMDGDLKKVIWEEGLPYGIHERTGNKVRFDSLQFHGNTKEILKQYYTGPPIT